MYNIYQNCTSYEKALNTQTYLDENCQMHSCNGLVVIICQFIIKMSHYLAGLHMLCCVTETCKFELIWIN
jgi:hypothetical protein